MNKINLIVDILMFIILQFLMAYALTGSFIHEILGTILFILMIIHHILNIKWFKNIFKGKYNKQRIYRTIINLLLLIVMFMQPISGILMSKLYSFINVSNTSLNRTIHLSLAYWSFVLMNMHVGIHLDAMIAKLKNNKNIYNITMLCLILIGIYGLINFISRNYYSYMFLLSSFAYFDYSESIAHFVLEHLAISIFFSLLGNYIYKLLK